ncbi:MAG: adaptor protein MecA [Clostridia bacterium]|nr:adaptor protein MecA [Oscillospiraceae bacterium]MBR6694765.1 adaptor protein MecA [Clostridia bacterium]
MQIVSNTHRQLKITLSAIEICDYFGTFKDIRYDNARSRAALGDILRQGIEATDFRLDSGRLSIKVYPTQSGGCNIYFTIGTARRLKKTDKAYIYEFSSCEDMLSACEQIKLHIGNIPLSLYYNHKTYRAIISGDYLSRRMMRIGSEYAEKIISERYEAEKTREHWRKICDNTPIGKIII